MAPILNVSVDLDELVSYHEIHGLEDAPGADSRAIWTTALPRCLELFTKLDIKATFFVVGKSLEPEIGIPAAQQLAEAGHELANHSFNHYYDLLRRGPAQRRDEIVRAADAIESATGKRPRGFRAPGYNIDDELVQLLAELGYVYDSSLFPCPPYYMTKAAALVAMRARGRQSKSLLGPKEVLLAPTEPYRVGDVFWRRRRRGLLRRRPPQGLMELPVAVLPGVRSPFIGTALTIAGPTAARVMALGMLPRRFIGLELHAIDFLDGDDDDVEPLVEHQPDLRVPLERKLEALETAISTLLASGAKPMTAFQSARALAKAGV